MADDHCTPPFQVAYKKLLESPRKEANSKNVAVSVEECELPLIDFRLVDRKVEDHAREMARASSEWGFFQLVNHGIPSRLMARMRREQVSLFRRPFERKTAQTPPGFAAGSYRWGVPSARCMEQLSWSEAYHFPLDHSCQQQQTGFNSLRSTVEEFSEVVSGLAQKLASSLSRQLGYEGPYFHDNCGKSSCYLRLNRYPPCPMSMQVNGMVPHTDSDFLTILCQDQVGGLQVKKDGRWIAVKPRPDALVVNIGDLFQVWSNGVYKSVEHRVVASPKRDRFSVAYFLCPSYDTVIESCDEDAPVYKRFTFKEYKEKVQEDVKLRGYKVGLSRFLA